MVIKEFVEKACGNGWRALIVFIGTLRELEECLSKEDLDIELCIAKTQDISTNVCNRVVNYGKAHRLLGAEFNSVALLLENAYGWPGNLIASIIDFVKKHGFLLIQAPERLMSTTFGKYFLGVALRSRNTLVLRRGAVVYENIFNEKPRIVMKSKPMSSDKLIRKLETCAVTPEQAYIIRIYPSFLFSDKKLLLIHGDRGRGKSGLLGLLALYTMMRKPGKYYITSKSPEAVQSFFKVMLNSMKHFNIYPSIIKKNNLVYGVTTGKSSIIYIEPWRIPRNPDKPLFIDEAASVGIARVRRWYNRIGKLVASTTVHGYEGSGRVLLKILREYFKKSIVVELSIPIRYYQGDPLEEFLYKVFHLDVEPEEITEVHEPLRYEKVHVEELNKDYNLLRKVYGLLFIAHYRNEPDDLVLLLDSGIFNIRVLKDRSGSIIGVALLREERVLPAKSYSEIIKMGFRVVDKLYRLGVYEELIDSRVWRIVRIAVSPPLQRKGYGSMLLKYIEDEAASNGLDAVVAIFSGFDTVRFWLKNEYTPIYISPRYNKVTGEKNIAVIKGLSSRWKNVEKTLGCILYQVLTYSSHILYRDLSAERLTHILDYLVSKGYTNYTNLKSDCKRLSIYVNNRGVFYHESIADILYKYMLRGISELRNLFNEIELLITVARVFQGKTIRDLATILKCSIEDVEKIVENTMYKLAEILYFKLCRNE
ncbi:MAG: GNAT family N-acetyltransferase [Thermoprotei archaeon]